MKETNNNFIVWKIPFSSLNQNLMRGSQMTNYNALNVFKYRHFKLGFLHFRNTEIWFSFFRNTWALLTIFDRSGQCLTRSPRWFQRLSWSTTGWHGHDWKAPIKWEHILRLWFIQVVFGSKYNQLNIHGL